MPYLTIHLEDGSPPVPHIAGEVDKASAGELQDSPVDALAQNSSVVFDLGEVTFIDVIGARAILGPAASMDESGPLTIANAPRLASLLDVIGLGQLSTITFRATEVARGR